MALKRIIVLMLLLSLLLSMTGCKKAETSAASQPQTQTPTVTPSPEPAVTAQPAQLLTGVETDRKVVSLIFEGYTDAATMEAIAQVLKDRDVPSTFFISGITANENPQVLQKLAAQGFAIGNYGMSGGKHLETLSAYENMRRFKMAQKEIAAACGREPELARCNGTIHTDGVLRAVAAAGLRAAVEPTAFLNHKSFRAQEDAETYVLNVLRGSIITVKLGQELDENEYDDPGRKLDERPAIDPSPGIRWEWSTEDERFALLPDIVMWLVDALKANGYSFTDPMKLQSEKSTILSKIRELEPEEEKLLNPERYEIPVTGEPLRTGETRKAVPGDFRGAVFVGDAVIEGLGAYVDWLREVERDYLDDAQFLTENQLSVEKLLEGESEIGDLARRLKNMNAKSVWLCLGYANPGAYHREAYLAKYRLLIKEIRDQNPNIRIVILPVLPKMNGYAGVSNESRFELDLRLCGMCREYDIPFVDIASAVRDETGQLREDYCLDLSSRGCHLNDAGCAAVVDYIRENYPV